MTTKFDDLLGRFHGYLASVDDALVRDAVARIGWAMPARALEPLLSALKDSDAGVRRQAAWAVGVVNK